MSTLDRPLEARDVMNAREVSDLIRMPESTVQYLARRGVIPSSKVGRRRLFLRAEIERLLAAEGAREHLTPKSSGAR